MYGMKGRNMDLCLKCHRPSCIWPGVCRNLNTDHTILTSLYKKVNSIDGIKKAFIGSGIRYDLLFPEWNSNAGRAEEEYLRELILNHVSGRLKVAPEHTSENVLRLMRKPPFALFRKLKKRFDEVVSGNGLNYEIVPYFISSHPGSTTGCMKELASEIKNLGIRPEQVQDFTPTPMTLSSVIYYTGIDPYTGRKVYVPKDPDEKRRQKDLFFWYRKDKRDDMKKSGGKWKPDPEKGEF